MPLRFSSYSTVSGTIAPGNRKIPPKNVPRSAINGSSAHGCPSGINKESRKQEAPPLKAAMHAWRFPHRDPQRAHNMVAKIAAHDPAGYRNPVEPEGSPRPIVTK